MKRTFFQRLKAVAVCAVTTIGTLAATVTSTTATTVSADSEYNYAKLLQYSMYFYDANMCGTEVSENTLLSWRGDCHTYDSQVPLVNMGSSSVGTNLSEDFIEQYRDILDPDGDGYIDVSGGFHDAGDHVEFGMPENYAAATLAWGYYEFRESYEATGQDSHIETILRYFSDYLIKCTFRDTDGTVIAFCYQVGDGDIDHAYWESPELDTMDRPAYFLTADKPQTDYVASAAASLAINYLNFKDTDPEYAQECLDYALALYDFAFTNEKQLSDNSDGPKSYYVSSKWEDDYCWASAWLYKITGDYMYLEEIYKYYDYYATPCYVYCWNDMWSGVQCILGEISMDEPYYEGEYVYPGFIDSYKEYAGKSVYEQMDCWGSVAEAIEKYMSGGLGTITSDGYFYLSTWGSARYNTAAQFIALVYDKYNYGEASTYSEWAKSQMDYLLGDNSLDRCYVVGYSEKSVQYPHHRASSGTSSAEDTSEQRHVLYGALVGGPDANDQHNDVTSDYIYNEVTIDYNAAFVGAAAGLFAFFGSDMDEVDEDFPPEEEGGSSSGSDYYVRAYAVDDVTSTGAGVTKLTVLLETDSIVPKTDITIRYYFSIEEFADASNISLVSGAELYDQTAMETSYDGVISGPYQYDAEYDPYIYYVEISWDGYTICNSNKKYQFTVGLYYGDTWDPTNDWSYQGITICSDTYQNGSETRTDYICVYSDGVLIGGIEPDGTTVSDLSDGILGDVNLDGTVSVTDIVALTKYLLGETKVLSSDAFTQADMNVDSSVNVFDLTLLKQAVLVS